MRRGALLGKIEQFVVTDIEEFYERFDRGDIGFRTAVFPIGHRTRRIAENFT